MLETTTRYDILYFFHRRNAIFVNVKNVNVNLI